MRAAWVQIVDLKHGHCDHGNCHRLEEILCQASFAGRIRTSYSGLTADLPGESPALAVIRCPSDERLMPALLALKQRWPNAPFLGAFCEAPAPGSEVLTILARGFDDFVWCPIRGDDFFPRVERLLPQPTGRAHSKIRELKARHHFEAFVGESGALCGLLEKIPCVAASDATCIISGETGTGKELVARAIHYSSPRQQKPFVPVNCGALPEHLFENEVFGHHRGAYTDASSTEGGLLALAEEGTIFFDEIDSLSSAAQVKLLRFLQDRQYRPLGASRAVQADVRVLAATNVDLRALVEAKRFREDLFHRLNIVYLKLPSLRERVEDLPLLAAHFVKRYGRQYRGGEPVRLSEGALQKLFAYSWPGNIRELEAVLQRSIILLTKDVLSAADIDLPGAAVSAPPPAAFRDAKSEAIGQFERAYLVGLLTEHRGNVSRAAKAAGKERRAFQRLLQKHNVVRQLFDEPA